MKAAGTVNFGAEQAKGFSLYAIWTIMAWRADELLDLVTTNVSRRIPD